MTDLDNVVLDKGPDPASPQPSRPRRMAAAIAALVLIAGAAALYWYVRRTDSSLTKPSTAAAANAQVSAVPPAPLGVETEPVDVPPLDQSDVFVRDLVRGLSSHPSVIAWLTTTGLIRNFVVVVDNIAAGATPARHLRVLAPSGPFRVVEDDGEIVVDPAGYRRYDAIAAAVDGIDPAGAARAYSILKPRMEEASRELGTDVPFDVTLQKAVVSLLQVPVARSAALVPHGALYRFADPRLEGLTAAQKQLLRMGPEHVRVVQQALRRIAEALGMKLEGIAGIRGASEIRNAARANLSDALTGGV